MYNGAGPASQDEPEPRKFDEKIDEAERRKKAMEDERVRQIEESKKASTSSMSVRWCMEII